MAMELLPGYMPTYIQMKYQNYHPLQKNIFLNLRYHIKFKSNEQDTGFNHSFRQRDRHNQIKPRITEKRNGICHPVERGRAAGKFLYLRFKKRRGADL